jgi:hypothetical protein
VRKQGIRLAILHPFQTLPILFPFILQDCKGWRIIHWVIVPTETIKKTEDVSL